MTAAQAPAAAPQGEKDKRHGNMPMNMVTTFAFFKLDRQFRLLSQSERDNAKQAVVECFKNAPKSLWLRSYSTFGLREDADLFIWMVSKNVEDIHNFMADLYRTPMGAYLDQTYNYLAVSKESPYTEGHEHEGPPIENESAPYLFVYPFIKTRQWYQEPFENRMRMMKQHIDVGHEFPSVTINTAYSFGIDDQDFVVSFDGHSLEEFVKLVMKLRETEASLYTHQDKPMFVGIKNPINKVLDSLGI